MINKTDLAPYVEPHLDVMRRDSLKMRGERPFLMVSLREKEGVEEVIQWVREQLASHVTNSRRRRNSRACAPKNTRPPGAAGPRIELVRVGDETRLGTCYQQVPVRLMPPFVIEEEPASLLYLINLTAGLMDGDGHLMELRRAGRALGRW